MYFWLDRVRFNYETIFNLHRNQLSYLHFISIMSLTFKQEPTSFVLIADRTVGFNPGAFSSYWFDSKNIIKATEIDTESIFTPHVTRVIWDNKCRSITISHDSIQMFFASQTDSESLKRDISAVLLNMESVKLAGSGLNFNFLIYSSKSIHEVTKHYFSNNKNPISRQFDTEDSKFGAYYSKNVSDLVRLKLDIKPVVALSINMEQSDAIQCLFNFHSDLRVENQINALIEIIDSYDDWKKTVEDIKNDFTE